MEARHSSHHHPVGVLYLSYDGMMEPLGESQVIGYLKYMCQSRDYRFFLMSFEKRADLAQAGRFRRIQELLKNYRIDWYPNRYHKSPSLVATVFDIFIATTKGAYLIWTQKIQIIHARSYVPAVSAWLLKKLFGVRFVFDMRGFWADERADGGHWARSGLTYKVVKWLEKKFLLDADAVVSLTHAGVEEIQRFPYLQGLGKDKGTFFSVIPTCADLQKFKPTQSAKLAHPGEFVLGHIGSIGSWYLFDEAIEFFQAVLKFRPQAKLIVINRGEHARILSALAKNNVPLEQVEVQSANSEEMGNWLGKLHAAVFFIKPFYSKKASAPTKLAELLACGIPCAVNGGVGDLDRYFADTRIGVSLKEFTPDALEEGALRMIELAKNPDTESHCRAFAEKNFSVAEGAEKYLEVYRKIMPRTR